VPAAVTETVAVGAEHTAWIVHLMDDADQMLTETKSRMFWFTEYLKALQAENEQQKAKVDQLQAEKEQMVAEKEQMVAEKEQMVAEKLAIATQLNETKAQLESSISEYIYLKDIEASRKQVRFFVCPCPLYVAVLEVCCCCKFLN